MDLSLIWGIILAFGFNAYAISLGPTPLMFIHFPSMMIVFGGTVGVTIARFGRKEFLMAVSIVQKAFFSQSIKPDELIRRIVEVSDKSRKEGLLSLEGYKSGYDFLDKAVQMLVDGQKKEIIFSNLEHEMAQINIRFKSAARIFAGVADAAPPMGMIGTLIGLVQMLKHMDDPKMIGPAMGTALLTTFYAAALTNLVAAPIAEKISTFSESDTLLQDMVLTGIEHILDGQSSILIADMLSYYVDPAFEPEGLQKEGANEGAKIS